MNIIITTFTNPFSFFCMIENSVRDIVIPVSDHAQSIQLNDNIDPSKVNHGQYVAVLWQNKWARGIISMESQCLIWLIDFGIYLRPNDKTIYIDLPSEYKKLPTKVFEASIHGVMPVDKKITDDCEIVNEVSTGWNKGAIEKMQQLLKYSKRLYFVPVALLSTKDNDVVLGNLYFESPGSCLTNVIDELEEWPVFAEKNKSAYIKNIFTLYTSRKRHRACHLKPLSDLNLPNITTKVSFKEYESICSKIPDIQKDNESESLSGDGSTVLNAKLKQGKTVYTLTSDEIEIYSNLYITIGDREYNALNVLLNKIRDLRMCELYRDMMPIGRATTRFGSHDT